eukprot:4200071-Prymnesium_polylepis.1
MCGHRLGVTGRKIAVSAGTHGELSLRLSTRNDRDMTAERLAELDAHHSQTTEADKAEPSTSTSTSRLQRRIHGGPCAHDGPGMLERVFWRHEDAKVLVHHHRRRVAAEGVLHASTSCGTAAPILPVVRLHVLRTPVLLAMEAAVALQAGIDQSADAHMVADPEFADM